MQDARLLVWVVRYAISAYFAGYAVVVFVVIDDNLIGRHHLRRYYHFGQGVLEVFLYGTLERSSAILSVVSLVGYVIFSSIGQFERVTQIGYASVESGQLDVDDAEYCIAIQLIEHHDVVHAVEEFGRESFVERFKNDALAVLLG